MISSFQTSIRRKMQRNTIFKKNIYFTLAFQILLWALLKILCIIGNGVKTITDRWRLADDDR